MTVVLPTISDLARGSTDPQDYKSVAEIPRLHIVTAQFDDKYKAGVMYFSEKEKKMVCVVTSNPCDSTFAALKEVLVCSKKLLSLHPVWGRDKERLLQHIVD
nr:hypothetical protein B0A51_10901 [Rachicladosporium sp. CCFEE 5018]